MKPVDDEIQLLVVQNVAPCSNFAEILPAFVKDSPENQHKCDSADAHYHQCFRCYLINCMHA
jgi:hypothetical protein